MKRFFLALVALLVLVSPASARGGHGGHGHHVHHYHSNGGSFPLWLAMSHSSSSSAAAHTKHPEELNLHIVKEWVLLNDENGDSKVIYVADGWVLEGVFHNVNKNVVENQKKLEENLALIGVIIFLLMANGVIGVFMLPLLPYNKNVVVEIIGVVCWEIYLPAAIIYEKYERTRKLS